MASAYLYPQDRIAQHQQTPARHGDGRGLQVVRRPATRHRAVNVSETERWLSLIGGGALAAFGLGRRSLAGLALAVAGGALVYRGLTGHSHLYGTLGMNTADHHGPQTSVAAGHGVKVERTILINAPREELYQFWRNLENLPRVMHHLKSIENLGNKRSHWVASTPLGKTVEWNAEIINDKENELIAWRSLEGAGVDNAGSVHFTEAPNRPGTEVKVVLKYDPPGGQLTANIARLFGKAPGQLIMEDLLRFKHLMESGQAANKMIGERS
jgi:uncharacterized membrane protein